MVQCLSKNSLKIFEKKQVHLLLTWMVVKFTYEGTGETKLAYEKFTKLFEERKNAPSKNDPKYKVLDIVNDMHILSTAEDLLKCLKEYLISELVVEVRTRNLGKDRKPFMVVKSRERRFSGSFGKFPQCKLDIYLIKKVNGKHNPFS